MSEPSLQTAQLHAWLTRIHAGDRAARDELLRGVCGRLERLARRMLRGFPNVRRHADTADVLQSALMRLLTTLERLGPTPETARDFFALAAGHIRRELIDLARYYATAKRQPGARAAPLGPDDSAAPEPQAAADDPGDLEAWQRFHEAVERLPVEEREVVGLVFYHGWSQADIADLFHVTDRTVRRRWQSACVKLTEALGGRLPGA